ncbi:type II secretion system protein [Candidatus Saccharibacteria bacterium]|nr:type II secretion system protein [Candidatus Saccharibacteria bacterium]MBQ3476199.1 type II secretion system protein [Candidatus Saccharibacteria bacterium]
MAKLNTNSKQGFTIIEVVLVLAIAGLIFLMVFVALPALQRSQRDTARRNDMSRVDTSLIQYQTNNQDTGNGDLPTTASWDWKTQDDDNDPSTFPDACKSNKACSFLQRYMNSGTDSDTNTFKDPDGTYYNLDIAPADTPVPELPAMNYTIYVRTGAKCSGEDVATDAARHFAILYRLEGAGIYCIDDQ